MGDTEQQPVMSTEDETCGGGGAWTSSTRSLGSSHNRPGVLTQPSGKTQHQWPY